MAVSSKEIWHSFIVFVKQTPFPISIILSFTILSMMIIIVAYNTIERQTADIIKKENEDILFLTQTKVDDFKRLTKEEEFSKDFEKWPIKENTGRIVLINEDDNGRLYIDSALAEPSRNAFREPLETAVADEIREKAEGIVEVVDKRGTAYIYCIVKIPDSNSYVAAIIEKDIAYKGVRKVKAGVIIITVLVIMSFAAIALAAWIMGEHSITRSQLDILSRNANDIVLLINKNRHVVDANERALNAYGYSYAELIGIMFDKLRAPDAGRLIVNEFTQAEIKDGLVIETTAARMDSSTFPVEESWRLIEIDELKYFQGIIRDISERRKAQDEIRSEKDRAEGYLKIASVIIMALDKNMNITLMNSKGYEVLDYEEGSLTGRNVIELFVPDPQKDHVSGVLRDLLSNSENFKEYNENNIVTNKGEERLIAWHNVRITDDKGGIIGLLCCGEDITEKRKAQLALEKSEHEQRVLAGNLTEAFNAINNNQRFLTSMFSKIPGMAFHCENDSERTVYYISDGCFDLTGYRSAEFIKSRAVSLMDITHVKDRGQVLDAVGISQSTGEPFTAVYRILTKELTEKWVMEHGYCVFDSEGRSSGVESYVMDITTVKGMINVFEKSLEDIYQALGPLESAVENKVTIYEIKRLLKDGLSSMRKISKIE